MKRPQIFSIKNSPIPYSQHVQYKYLYMWAWCWDWDGKRMIKVQYRLRFEFFPGTKPISELPYYPLAFYEKPDELRSTILKESLRFLKATALCFPGSSQMFLYEGTAYADRRQILAREEISGGLVR
jgi:hypothetical protein